MRRKANLFAVSFEMPLVQNAILVFLALASVVSLHVAFCEHARI